MALGTASHVTYIYSLDDASLSPRFSHVLTPSGVPVTDHISALSWSPDFHALAVGYAATGVGVWGVYGNILLQPLLDIEASRTLTPLGT